MNVNQHMIHDGDRTPNELLGIASALDRLAASDRASARAGLEDRLLIMTRRELSTRRDPESALSDRALVAGSITPTSASRAPAARMAASVAVLIGGGLLAALAATWSGGFPGSGSSSVTPVAARDLGEKLDEKFSSVVESVVTSDPTAVELRTRLASAETAVSDLWGGVDWNGGSEERGW
ncbi:MAG: hypothetical protein IBJ11_02440 [Phycisphaerales bacterium]|nr:hypothetical protein [Phycisphaerales bacterium]